MSGAEERARHDATTDERAPREAGADRQARLRFDASLPEHATRNRAWWDADSERYQAVQGQQLREAGGSAWGVWQIPEAELRILGDVAGLTTVELGCGAAQWSIALAQAGATAIGVDLSEAQLRAAWAAADEAGVSVRLIHASAEALPLPDASADIAFCDWGASRFADPDAWVPEAARILRPGGLLAFSTATPLLDLCWADRRRRADRVARRRRIRARSRRRRRDDRVPAHERRLDRALPAIRAAGRGPHRAAGAGGRDVELLG